MNIGPESLMDFFAMGFFLLDTAKRPDADDQAHDTGNQPENSRDRAGVVLQGGEKLLHGCLLDG